MKVLFCLFAVLAAVNAGLLHSNGLYGSGLLRTGSYISAPVTYVQSAPALQTVQVVRQPVYQNIASTVYSSPAQIYHTQTAPIYHSASVLSAPVVSTSVVSRPVVSAPVISSPVVSVPAISTTYGLRYANSYAIGGQTKVISVLKDGFLKHK